MKKKKIISVILFIISVILTVIGVIFLPATVITQISVTGSPSSTMPKILAVLLPFALSMAYPLTAFFSKDEDKTNFKVMLVTVVGFICYGFMFFVNLI